MIGQDFTWPTPKNITEVQAFQKCKTTVEASVAFQGCKDVPDIGFSVSLDSCVIDIQVFQKSCFMFHALVTVSQCSHSSCQETLITVYDQKAFCSGIKLKNLFFSHCSQIMDDLVWAEEALTAIIQRCQTQLEINTELWVNVSGEITPNPTIIDNLCPNECSGQGTCKDSESI